MTQADLELIARKMRARGLHSSWDGLLTFSKDVVGNLVDVYQALLKNSALPDKISSTNPDDAQRVVKDKLSAALVLLTSKAQVAKWESEALAGNNVLGTAQAEGSGFKEK